MRIRNLLTAFFFLSLYMTVAARAQVQPAAYVAARPIGIGVGISDYNLDYGPGRRMAGPVIRGSVGIFHGLGVDVSARSLFMFTPAPLTRMQQSTFTAGAYYETPSFLGFRMFARGAGGLGLIEFPSRNPKYTRDSYTVYAAGGGFEHHLVDRAYLRAEYEYQFWQQYHGAHDLNPQGVTLGVTYYLSGNRTRFH